MSETSMLQVVDLPVPPIVVLGHDPRPGIHGADVETRFTQNSQGCAAASAGAHHNRVKHFRWQEGAPLFRHTQVEVLGIVEMSAARHLRPNGVQPGIPQTLEPDFAGVAPHHRVIAQQLKKLTSVLGQGNLAL